MPPKYATRKRKYRRTLKRGTARKRMRNRAAKLVNSRYQTFYFTRKAIRNSLVPVSIAPSTPTYTFTLGDIPDVSDFANLFDQYTLHAVKMTFYPSYNSADTNPWATAAGIPKAYYCIDYDDSGAFTSINEVLQRGNVKIRSMNRQFSIYLKPKVLSEVYRSSVATAYAPKRSQSLDMSNTGVPHYGVKFVLDQVPNDGQFTMTCVTKYYFSCRNVR